VRVGTGVRAAIRNSGLEFPIERITEAGLFGGGSVPHPGEISLACHGVLFLDA
jgi:magnesium chelatase family protein